MMKSILILMIGVVGPTGSGERPEIQGESDRTPSDHGSIQPVGGRPSHVFPAEIYFESRSADRGVSKGFVPLEPHHESGTSWTRTVNYQEIALTMLDGTVYEFQPSFVEHRDGHDVWLFRSNHPDQEGGGEQSPGPPETRLQILFDGTTPVPLIEEQAHSIVIRRHTTSGSEQSPAGDRLMPPPEE